MNNIIRNVILCFLTLIIMCGCYDKNDKREETSTNNEGITNMKIIIDDKEYIVKLEDNETVNHLIDLLPLTLTMNDLNGNEKYVYMNTTLPTNSIKPKHINKGDIMLYGNDCLVIFYKSFNTSYSYTKIGHIDNLPDFDNSSISVLLTIL